MPAAASSGVPVTHFWSLSTSTHTHYQHSFHRAKLPTSPLKCQHTAVHTTPRVSMYRECVRGAARIARATLIFQELFHKTSSVKALKLSPQALKPSSPKAKWSSSS